MLIPSLASSDDWAELCENSFLIAAADFGKGLQVVGIGTGTYTGKTVTISRAKTVTKKKYDTKLPPDELLPKTAARKTDTVMVDSVQALTDEQKQQARANIGAGISNFSGSYNDLTDKPTTSKVVLNSITSGSTKKFEITVDDSGTISATEVTT